MRHLLILAFCWAGLALAQTQAQTDTIYVRDTVILDSIVLIRDTVSYDTTITHKIKFGFESYESRVYTRFLMLDFGISTYLHGGSLNMPTDLRAMDQNLWGSKNFTLHVIKQQVALDKKHRININYGLSFDFNRYRFTNDQKMLEGQDVVTFTEAPGENLRKNQLRATYMTLPVMMTLKLKPKNATKHFKISLGGYAGVLVGSRYRYQSDIHGKEKISDDFNLNRFRYGLSARAGYGIFNIYVNYGLNPLFKESEQGIYDLRPINFGIALIPF